LKLTSRKLSTLIIVVVVTLLLSTTPSPLIAQAGRILKCGDIVEGEVVKAEQNKLVFWRGERFGDFYNLDIKAGTRVNIAVSPLGKTFNSAFVLLDSGGTPVLVVNKSVAGELDNLTDFELGSSKQILVVIGIHPKYATNEDPPGWSFGSAGNVAAGQYFGAYRVNVGCTLPDGKVIEPGDSASTTSNPAPSAPAFTGVGFPGLPPVDFSKVAKIPLPPGTAMAGAITPTGGEILGYVFDGKANSTPELTFTRLSGNLNLGLVVLSEDNKVVYQASLVTSKAMTTTIELPKDGKYTVGVFRIDLLPPAAPEATAFQVQIK
jgi:hypothetical protein